MRLVKDKEQCCGCSACEQKCPFNAIKMTVDEEGFYYPAIDEEACTNCGLCTKVCNNLPPKEGEYTQEYYAAKSCSMEDRMRSRSGGAFFEMAKHIIGENGAVYGSVIESDMTVRHIRANTMNEVCRMQGSKYVESDIPGVYAQVEADLESGLEVLFSGTACQVAGLYGYLKYSKGITLENLFTVDIVCHGVVSRKIFADYINFIEKKYHGKVEKFNFRDKSFGWNTHVETFVINGKKHARKNYTNIFYSNKALRPSCGNCAFASYNRPGDITVADFWGLKDNLKDFDDNKGVSAVMVNTENGDMLFSAIQTNVDMHEVDKKTCSQPNLHNPSKIPANRSEFWNCYRNQGFMGVMKTDGRYDILRRIKWHLVDFRKIKNNKLFGG